jgi:hypothetical protein
MPKLLRIVVIRNSISTIAVASPYPLLRVERPMPLPPHDQANPTRCQGGDPQTAGFRAVRSESSGGVRGGRGWMLNLVRALLRTPERLSRRQRRWALLRAVAAETPRPDRHRNGRELF